jgi:hypothetical protein
MEQRSGWNKRENDTTKEMKAEKEMEMEKTMKGDEYTMKSFSYS